MRLVVTRPEPDAQALARQLEEHGIEAMCAPLLEIRGRQNTSLPDEPVQAVLVTSANGVRALGAHSDFARFKDLPCYAVGDASAAEAKAAGFGQVHSASGDLAALQALVKQNLKPDGGPLLYVTGSKIAGDLAGLLAQDDFKVMRVVLYDAMAVSCLPQDLIEAVKAGHIDGVILMSPRAAKVWGARLLDAGLDQIFAKLRYYCLSPAVKAALQTGLKVEDGHIGIAAQPTQKALIEGVLAQKSP